MSNAVHDRTERQLRKYGLTPDQWERILTHQHGRCAACGKVFSSTRLACPDHDHRSGFVRGALCTPCNYELGCHHDSTQWFKNVAQYLTHPPAEAAGVHVFVPGSIGASHER